MARCDFATWRPIYPEMNAPGTPGAEPYISVKAIVFHTAVSKGSSLYGYFGRDDIHVESHFYNNHEGHVEQYIDTSRQADAQYSGNAYCVSVESEDGGDPEHTPWNPAQLESNARLAAWAHKVHGVELVKAYKHSDGTIHGVGYHAQFHDEWNLSGHSCPAAPRIAQMPALIARARELAGSNDGGTTSQGSALPGAFKVGTLTVDGVLGAKTIKRWQEVNGTPVDGVISVPSALVRRVQTFLNKHGAGLLVDGKGIQPNTSKSYGPTSTIKALQRYYGTPVDGVLSHPESSCVKALQRALNNQG